MAIDDLEIKAEITEAKHDLRESLNELNDRVEQGIANLRPDRGLREHPIATACVAGSLGFALGADSREISIFGLLVLGATVLLSRDHASEASEKIEDDDERV